MPAFFLGGTISIRTGGNLVSIHCLY